MDLQTAENLIETYERLRNRAYEIARQNPKVIMGDDAWLFNAMNTNDMVLMANSDGITVYGSCWTSQTMTTEFFSFIIPYDRF